MAVRLREISIPDFGLPNEVPQIPSATYERRCRDAYEAAGAHWLVVYGDREHFANIMFLSGFDPRFEEALLVLGPNDRRIIVAGNECVDYAPLAALPKIEIVLAQSFGLMGQDRSRAPNLSNVLGDIGLKSGDNLGLAGWKYLEAEEWTGQQPTFFAPAFVVDTLRQIAGDPMGVTEATHFSCTRREGCARSSMSIRSLSMNGRGRGHRRLFGA
jgi:hypothetical protein